MKSQRLLANFLVATMIITRLVFVTCPVDVYAYQTDDQQNDSSVSESLLFEDSQEKNATVIGFTKGPEHFHSKGLHHEAISGKCNSNGNVEYWDCDGCDDKLDDNANVISSIITSKDKNNHATELLKTNRIEPTENTYGCKEYWTCRSCNISYKDATAGDSNMIGDSTALALWKEDTNGGRIDKTGSSTCKHPNDKITVVNDIPATCETDGMNSRKCTECGKVIETGIVVNALGHEYIDGICSRDSVISLKLCKDINLDIKSMKFNESAQTPEVAVSYKDQILIKDVDYTLFVEPKTDIGSYDVIVEGIGGYRDSVIEKWSILPVKGLYCKIIPDQIYTGKPIKPDVDVYSDGNLLISGKDYTLSYGKYNTKVANREAEKNGKSIAPSVIIKGKGNYSGTVTATFSIIPYNISSEINVDNVTVAKPKNNKAVKAFPVVMLNGKKLKEGTDYVVSTTTNVLDVVQSLSEAKDYDLYVVGKNNYSGYVPFRCTITEKTLASKVTIKKIIDQKYTGNEIEPVLDITSKIEGRAVPVNSHFIVEYENNKEIGTAKAIITAKPESELFAGSKTITFKITGEHIKNAKLGTNGKGTIPARFYDGNPYEPDLDLYVGTTPLTKDEDYKITYTKNVNVGTATAVIKGKGKYTGTKKFTYKITKYDASKAPAGVITVNNGKELILDYEKGGVTPKPTISMNGAALVEKKDYTIKYLNNKSVGAKGAKKNNKSIAPTMIISFKGNLSGNIPVEFTIVPKNISKCTVIVADKVVSTKSNGWKQKVSIIDTNGKKLAVKTDYEQGIKYYGDAGCQTEIVDGSILVAGTTVYVKVVGANNYVGSEIIGSYRIASKNISSVTAKIADQVYTGEEIRPTDFVVIVGKGASDQPLMLGTDYKIESYRNNLNKGKASVTIRGINDYCGTKVINFYIKDKAFKWWK